jgi:hypothetical protein
MQYNAGGWWFVLQEKIFLNECLQARCLRIYFQAPIKWKYLAARVLESFFASFFSHACIE